MSDYEEFIAVKLISVFSSVVHCFIYCLLDWHWLKTGEIAWNDASRGADGNATDESGERSTDSNTK